MQRILCSYTIYFNKTYNESGPLFESRFKASLINSESYYIHIARYIDMNPRNWLEYDYSSLAYLRNGYKPTWFQPIRIQTNFKNFDDYLQFLKDYEERKDELNSTKYLVKI